MIQFACHCKHMFELEDDMSGGMIQCPECGRLCDVPTADEAKQLESDGTYNLGQTVQPDTLAKMDEAFGRHYVDNFGNEIDMRGAVVSRRPAQVEEMPIGTAGPERVAPKYDPVTGELIRPMVMGETPQVPAVKPD